MQITAQSVPLLNKFLCTCKSILGYTLITAQKIKATYHQWDQMMESNVAQFFRKFAQKKPFQFIKLKVTNIFENKPKSHHIF